MVVAACSNNHTPSRIDEAVLPDGRVISEPTDFQAEILEDELVTWGEYERSVLAAIRCLEEQGVRVDGPRRSADGARLDFIFFAEGTEEEAEEAETVYSSCYERYQAFVAEAWFLQSIPSERERSELLRGLVDCLSDAGADLPDSPALDQLLEARDTVGQDGTLCFNLHKRYFLVPPP